MAARPVVSVIVPVYNASKYLSECLDSLLAQSLRQIEIIAVNDGSRDNSGNILDDYATKDQRINVIHKPNGGTSTARNTGLDHVRGQYVHFLDADDWMEPDAYRSATTTIKQHDDVDLFVFNSFEHHDDAGTSMRIRNVPEGVYNRIAILKYAMGIVSRPKVLSTYYLSVTNKMFDASVFFGRGGDVLRFKEGMTHLEDGELLLRVLTNIRMGYVGNRGLHNIRYHSESALGALDAKGTTRRMLHGYEQLIALKEYQSDRIASAYIAHAHQRAALHYLRLCIENGQYWMADEIAGHFTHDHAFQDLLFRREKVLREQRLAAIVENASNPSDMVA